MNLIAPEECERQFGAIRRAGRSRRVWGSSPGAAIPFPAQPGSIIGHWDLSQAGSVTAVSNKASAVANLTGSISAWGQGTAGNQPGYGLTTLNGLNTLDCASSKFMTCTLPGTTTDLTFQCVIVVASSLIGDHVIFGNATASIFFDIIGGAVRVGDFTGSATSNTFADLTVIASSAHILTWRRVGASWDAWLDGTKSANGGSLTTNPPIPACAVANDDTSVVAEVFNGQIAEAYYYGNKGLTDAEVISNQAALKLKWGTP